MIYYIPGKVFTKYHKIYSQSAETAINPYLNMSKSLWFDVYVEYKA